MSFKTTTIGDVFTVLWEQRMTLPEMQEVIRRAEALFKQRNSQQFIGLSIVSKGTELPDRELRNHMDASQATMSRMQRSTHIVFADATPMGKFALGVVNLVLQSKGRLFTGTDVRECLEKAREFGPFSPTTDEVLRQLRLQKFLQ